MESKQKTAPIDKVLIYEKTVYRLTARLRRENLTEEGNYDFSKISDLRIVDNGLLKKIRAERNLTQPEIAKRLGVSLRTWIGWEFYKKAMPFEKILLLAERFRISESELYGQLQDCEFTFGNHHGNGRMRLPLSPRQFHLMRYLIPEANFRTYVLKNAPEKIKEEVREKFTIDEQYYRKTGLVVTYSYLLNTFLRTFYEYKRECKLLFPLSTEVPDWIDKGADLRSAIVAFLLSDGGEKPGNKMFICGESEIVHKVWADAWLYKYNLLPSSYKVPTGTIYATTHNVPKDIVDELKTITPGIKKSPKCETKNEYLRGPQPSIAYLLQRPVIEQQIAIRIWANTEGSTGFRISRDGMVIPLFQIACAHPTLIEQLMLLCKANGMNLVTIRDPRIWAGFSKLKSLSITTTVNFLKIGGFLRGTRIKSASKYFYGLDKQDVLLGVLELALRQRKGEFPRTQDKGKVFKAVRRIVTNKELKDERYYLDAFENHDNWSFRRK